MLPTRADAVVVGAGAFGLSVAWWLARLGAGHVVLLDQYQPGSQASPRAAGLFKLIQADETRTRLARLAVEIVTGFEALTAPRWRSSAPAVCSSHARPSMHACWNTNARSRRRGGLSWKRWMAPRRHVGCRRSRHRASAPPCTHLAMSTSRSPPASCRPGYTHSTHVGVAVLSDTPATGLQVVNGALTAVVTPQGVIETPVVVDAAGAWSRAVASLAGVAAPIVALRHQLFITEPVPGRRCRNTQSCA